ncbi:hypothetical protein MMC25_007762 [Agyrium rufum]|nr:hypothetical protein [Agyrium rufum]
MSSKPSTPSQTTSSLRPRNRRLISIDDEFSTVSPLPSPSSITANGPSGTSSYFSLSRQVSPVPSTHPSRSASSVRPPPSTQKVGRGGSLRVGTSNNGSLFSGGLWDSWSSLQGIASDLLGSGTGQGQAQKDRQTDSWGKGISATRNGMRLPSSQPNTWGPSGNDDKHVAKGSQEDRLAQVQAKKREALMQANGFSGLDASGRYKRRTSDEFQHNEAPREPTQDALVYLHRVQSTDTLMGVSIKYHCPVDILRKTNRLWPNDSIQIRKEVYLPVPSCSIRGRKISAPSQNTRDLLGDDTVSAFTTKLASPVKTVFESNGPNQLSTPSTNQIHSETSLNSSVATPWIHESWVSIPNFPDPVQIVRLPPRALGYFPPSRRKSVTYSDNITPPQSIDLPRSPKVSPRPPGPGPLNARQRSSSGSKLVRQLMGPGGVGNLNHETRAIGPGEDSLNKFVAQHLPSFAANTLAPPPSAPSTPRMSATRGVPRASFDSTTSGSSTAQQSLENVGGAIEGWMRRVAGRVGGVPESRNGHGDLIELVEGWELDSSLGSGGVSAPNSQEGNSSVRSSSTLRRLDEDNRLQERFPPRGRVFEDEGRKRS